MITSTDCRSCGACCASGPGYDDLYGWADCTVVDVRRLSRRVRARLVALPFEPFAFAPAKVLPVLATPATVTAQYGKVCDFLHGTPGRRVSCRIYATRPDVCRRFRAGSVDCLEARALIGLSSSSASSAGSR